MLVADPAPRQRMGEAGRRAVLPRSWDAVCSQLLGHYDEARQMHPTTPRRTVLDLSTVSGPTSSPADAPGPARRCLPASR